jgi:predicted nuclease of predicted toxin-antitoxin system
MRFLVDAQLPPALARWLAERGHAAEHVFDSAMAAADDRVFWDRALATGAVIITKDEDFAIRRALTSTGPSVVWSRLGNTRRRELLAWFQFRLPAVLVTLERGESLIEIV